MAFADDYARYVYLLNTVNAPGFDGASNLNLVEELPVYVQKMDAYASEGLVVLDLSRDIYVPTGNSGVTVPVDQLPPVVNPGIESPYNPTTGSTAPTPPTNSTVPPGSTPAGTTSGTSPAPVSTGMDYTTIGLLALGAYIVYRMFK